MSAPAERLLTEEEYLALERAAPYKSEFYAGQMFAMAGARRSHNLIITNVVRELSTQLLDSPCQVYPSDMRVKIDASGLYTYPDVTVTCGEEQFEDEDEDTLLNPTLIVEVLSESTEAYDRGEKFAHYRQLESLQEYVLISQDRARVERYARQGEGAEWLLTEARGLQGTMRLASIDCDLCLADVYQKVRLPAAGGAPPRLR
jgi:Uma2 family endonuclease